MQTIKPQHVPRLLQSYRQYSVMCDDDVVNLRNGRCPKYALGWSHPDNRIHWPVGHDYFMGNGKSFSSNEQFQLRTILSSKFARGTLPAKIVFCDLDGILSTNITAEQIEPANRSTSFFETLNWAPNGRLFWDAVRKYDPILLLDAYTRYSASAIEQTYNWCKRELGRDIHIIFAYDKSAFSFPNAVLIDTSVSHSTSWKSCGGKFILYTPAFTDKIIDRVHRHMDRDKLSSP